MVLRFEQNETRFHGIAKRYLGNVLSCIASYGKRDGFHQFQMSAGLGADGGVEARRYGRRALGTEYREPGRYCNHPFAVLDSDLATRGRRSVIQLIISHKKIAAGSTVYGASSWLKHQCAEQSPPPGSRFIVVTTAGRKNSTPPDAISPPSPTSLLSLHSF
ncbi:hypothetical protein BU26DRAFT_524597 [Trematosphaeria pertusa]|uniref:Uncharacterized protein n=1 Tax=Trematosphaeria pertusa TaxID=390896 RepID=A0A6A6HUS8_9PLEO|nr:uncharacterized protein BU26DRAFT_524597 [Trematosphaeria pertusa]KAF2241945.1 hypothetical protein BU26DRAFT_524597 [Trematosphaeria pertusa]